jgi:hypothetical protein
LPVDVEPWLVVDNRGTGPGKPGIHAFVLGVSRYGGEDDEFASIPGTAASAARFATFLRDEFHDPEGVPLRTIRMLLSPVEDNLPAWAKSAPEAAKADVEAALLAWLQDCDEIDDNIAVLYVSGHGVAGPDGTRYIFLSRAHGETNPYRFSVNLQLCVETIRRSHVQALIVVADCCALKSVPSYGAGEVAVTPNDLTRGADQSGECEYILTINAARTGTRAYAIDADRGTLLTANLFPLLKTAGELFEVSADDKDFRITDRRLRARLPAAVKQWLADHNEQIRADATIKGDYLYTGITRPDPPPEFRVHLEPTTEFGELTVDFCTQGKRIPYGTISAPETIHLPAGFYRVESKAGTHSDRTEFSLYQDGSTVKFGPRS